jgi:transcriptional regulator with XRE-family HTH domain
MVATGSVACVRLSPKACQEFETIQRGKDDRSIQRVRTLLRYFDRFCNNDPHRLTPEQYKHLGKFPIGGKVISLWEFKAFAWRVYGGELKVNGKKCLSGLKWILIRRKIGLTKRPSSLLQGNLDYLRKWQIMKRSGAHMKQGNVDANEARVIAETDLIIDVQFLLQDVMAEKGVTRTELAKAAGISKARISQLFRAEANPTLRSLARLFHVLGEDLDVHLKSAARSRQDAFFSQDEFFQALIRVRHPKVPNVTIAACNENEMGQFCLEAA